MLKPWHMLTLIGLGSLVVVLIVCGGLGIWFGLAVERVQRNNAAWSNPALVSGGAYATMSVPGQVERGQPFDLLVRAYNPTPGAVTLKSIGTGNSLVIESSDPPADTQATTTASYSLVIPPGANVLVTLRVVSHWEGAQSSHVGAVFDNGDVSSTTGGFEVVPPGEGEDGLVDEPAR